MYIHNTTFNLTKFKFSFQNLLNKFDQDLDGGLKSLPGKYFSKSAVWVVIIPLLFK